MTLSRDISMSYWSEEFSDLNVAVSGSLFHPAKGGVAECHVILNIIEPGSGFDCELRSIETAAAAITERLNTMGMRPVMMRYYMSDGANQAHRIAKPDSGTAVSMIEQPPLHGSKIALWIYLMSEVETDMDVDMEGGNGYMTAWRHGGYNHVWLTGSGIADFGSEVATMTLLDDYATRLDCMGMSLRDECVRTWFFVRDVDVNYSGVVKGRNTVFKSFGLTRDTHFIASTGIGGCHMDRRVCVQMDAYAVGGLQPGQVDYLYAGDYLNSTYEYGVAFERGTTIDYGDRRHILISGTASIDNKGRIVAEGDIVGQTNRMLANVGALLSEAGAGFDNVTVMTVYLRDIADYTCVSRMFDELLPKIPRVIVHAPVCRPGWLIEMECMATVEADNPQFAPL